MVMRKNAMAKNLRQSILKSLGRYIAIVAIIALGASMFVGLLMTKSDMVATGQVYLDEQNMFDLRLVSSYGWDLDQVGKIAQMDGVVDAEGVIYVDVISQLQWKEDESVLRFYALPETINKLSLRGGRMPMAPDECVIDGYMGTEEMLGATIKVSSANSEDTQEAMVYDTYTIVGFVATPLYMDMNRGTTSVGSGALETYLYIPRDGFDVDYYSEIHVTIPGEYDIYTDAYNDAMAAAGEQLEPQLLPLAEARYQRFRAEAVDAYHDGMLEYYEGVKAFHEGKAEAEQKLADAYQELLDAEEAIKEGEKELENGKNQLAAAQAQLYAGQKELDAGKAQLEEQKANMLAAMETSKVLLQQSKGSLAQQSGEYGAQIQAVDAQIQALNEELGPYDAQIQQLNTAIGNLDAQIIGCDIRIGAAQAAMGFAALLPDASGVKAQLESEIATQQALKAQYQGERGTLVSQRDTLQAEMGVPNQERQNLQNQKSQLEQKKAVVDQSLAVVETSLKELESGKAALDEQFASAEAEIQAGQDQINAGWAGVAAGKKKLEEGEKELAQGKLDLEEGWKEYEKGKLEAEQELADAEAELADGKAQLDEARELIQDMKELSLHILDRNSNIGYGSLDSASDIVQGVSRVFPAFFLLVAALVCITTMTRMIDEERTQIGTLKALGYSNSAIISKYLIYSGSGAILGCGLGVLVGSVLFPTILWQAYKIMLYITDGIVLRFNWWLCGIVVFAYTTVMLFVTWYCCRKALREQPAELIRPKAPDVGKKILLERLPFWHKISFLNKVTIRNIFRYRQRLAMMMVGIGGCTALLLTGFGLRDSIVNVVNYQFSEVTVYDLQVYFAEDQTEEDQKDFIADLKGMASDVVYYHQESMDLTAEDKTKELIVMAAESDIQDLIDFHSGEDPLSMPGRNEVLLTVGVAEAMGIRVGDTVVLRNADLEELELRVSGIYDNHVNNYAIITPGTMEAQWGTLPGKQMALVKAAEGQDVHALSAEITGMLRVMNVSVSEDLASMVGNMMDALDLVVWVIVFCAGLMAAIVLYNLTNINITERLREIATIKVLGFNAGETGAYVFKENLSLTAIGSVVGLGLGYLLLLFVMSQVKIDMVWFKAIAMPLSYVLAITLTMVAACIVDFIFYFKLDKINMAEALKSVE